jgi:RNA polymerase sigma-70 factor (ECF subfamily)
MREGNTSLGGDQSWFPETSWGLLSRLHDHDGEGFRAGLETLCRRYWKPVYGYLRAARAKSNGDAKDLTQSFFAWLLEGNVLEKFDPKQGGFRPYLKLLLRRFAINEDLSRQCLKRGGGARNFSLDDDKVDFEDLLADPRALDPEIVFDQLWIVGVVNGALRRVRERCIAEKRDIAFRIYEEYELSHERERPSYAQLAARLGIKERQVETHLFAVRDAVRAELRRELTKLTANENEWEGEWHALFGG